MGNRSPREADSAWVAAECYYWRPARGFSRALQLHAYARAGVRFDHPLLDLGCGDGMFGRALGRLGVVDGIDLGLDGSQRDLRLASPRPRLGLVQGDLCRLPLRDGALGSVIAHTVLSSLLTRDGGGVDVALAEIYRVLRPGAILALAVALPRFNENLAIADLLRRAGARSLLAAYVRRVNRRHSHTCLIEPALWREKLERTGFVIDGHLSFLTRREARWYGMLHLARGFPLLRLLPDGRVRRGVVGLEAALFRRILAGAPTRPPEQEASEAGFSLWLARKPASRSGRGRP